MKKIFLLLLLLPLSSIAQEYNVSAMMASGMTIKYDGIIQITDSLFVSKSYNKGKEYVEDYDIINERNGKVYLTDGVETHWYRIMEKSGKKKGKPYSYELHLTYDPNNGRGFVVYYITSKK